MWGKKGGGGRMITNRFLRKQEGLGSKLFLQAIMITNPTRKKNVTEVLGEGFKKLDTR